MNAVTEVDRNTAVAVPNEASSLMAVIIRAASDPAMDVDKVERLMAMHERAQARQAKLAFFDAKRAMRPALPVITMKGHIVIRDKNNPNNVIQDTAFARFEDIHEAIMPVLTEHGFELDFRNGMAPDGKVRVTTVLTHEAGHEETTYFDLPHDSSGSKNAVQAIGSSTSYAKRYGTLSILNIRVAGEDDDANTAIPDACISKEQRDKINGELDNLNADKAAFCRYLKVESVADILAKDFDKAWKAVEAKRRQASK